MVFDVRFLPNPHWIPELRPQTGLSKPVSDYVLGQPGAESFLTSMQDLMAVVSVGRYVNEGKRSPRSPSAVPVANIAAQPWPRSSRADLFHRPADHSSPSRSGPRVSPRDLAQIFASGSLTDFPTVVAFGGGHGLAASLTALRRVTDHLTAIVTVADDGGSSGRLRQELDCLPPGDLRMALAALCGDDESGRTWADVLQYRFSSSGPRMIMQSETCSLSDCGSGSGIRWRAWTWSPGFSGRRAGCCRWPRCRWTSPPR